MSVTWYIACPETKQRVWIGQGTFDNMYVYIGEPDVIACLADFLNMHIGKSLIVANIEDRLFDQLDYTDFCQHAL